MEIEIKPFTKVLEDSTRKFNKIPKGQYLEEGQFPIIDQSLEFIAGYTDDVSLVNFENLPVVIFGDHTRSLKYIDFPIALGADGAKALTLKNNEHNVRYLYYALKSLDIPNAGYSRHFKFLKESKLSLPIDPINQKRIAQILSDCEDLIAKRKESIKLLDGLVKSTFLEMFGDPIRNEKDWDWTNFKSLAKIDRKSISPENFHNYELYLGLEDIEKGTGNINKKSSSDLTGLKSSKFEFNETHILYGKLRPNLNKVSFPLGAGICSTDIFPILPKPNKANRYFVGHLMKTNYFVKKMVAMSSGANLPRVSTQALQNLKVYSPTLNIQNEFARIIENIEQTKTLYQRHLTELQNLYARLSQDAFKGDLDLSEVVLREEILSDRESIAEIANNKINPIKASITEKRIEEKTLKNVDNKISYKENVETSEYYELTEKSKPLDIDRLIEILNHYEHSLFFTFKDLVEYLKSKGYEVEFKQLRDILFSLLRKEKLVQVFPDAKYKSHVLKDDPIYIIVQKLEERIYLQYKRK